LIRRILPLVFVNMVVASAFAAVVIAYPNYIRLAAPAMPLLLVFNIFYLRSQRRRFEQAIATGKATPPSSAHKRLAMAALIIWGGGAYISGGFNYSRASLST
jgi:hypothetical protein